MKKLLILLAFLSFNVLAAPVDINKASAKEIAASLKGIGAKKAEEIVKYRRQHGAFKSLDELSKVKGIGEKTIAKNKQNIQLVTRAGSKKSNSKPKSKKSSTKAKQ